MKNRKISILLVLLLILSISTFSAFAADPSPVDLPDYTVANADTEITGTFSDVVLDTEAAAVIPEKPPEIQSFAIFQSPSDYFGVSGSLTASNTSDQLHFSVSSSRHMVVRVNSSISYRVRLFSVDWSTGNAYYAGVTIPVNGTYTINGLSTGDWMLLIDSTTSVGATYSAFMNAKNPVGTVSQIENITSNLKYVALRYTNNEIYSNGQYIATGNSASNSHLNWSRNFYFSHSGGYSQRTHQLSDIRVQSVSNPVIYSSQYASSNNAVLIYVDVNTLFTYHESQYVNGGGYFDTFLDIYGQKTPRRIDELDLILTPVILVYDLDLQKSIDFYSTLNMYYGAGIENMPTITDKP